MKPKQFDPVYIFIGLILLAGLLFGVYLVVNLQQDAFSRAKDTDQNIGFLFVITGNDAVELSQVAIFNAETGKVALFAIPNNLGQIINQLNRVDRVGVLYEEQGIEVYRQFLNQFFGSPIPFHIEIDEAGFSRITDLLGGLPIYLSDAIDTKDENGEVLVRIPNGNVILDGDKVLDFLRHVEIDERPAERTARQFSLVKGFFKQLGNSVDFFNQPIFRSIVEETIQTNLDLRSLEIFSEYLKEVDFENTITQRILGTERLVQTGEGELSLLFPHFEGKLVRDSVQQIRKSLESPDALFSAQGTLRVEILNGTTVNGLAQRTRDLLQNYGLDVVSFGNAEQQDQEETQIIYHTIEEAAIRVGNLIRGDNIIPGSGENTDGVDVTVILGKDFDGWYVKPKN